MFFEDDQEALSALNNGMLRVFESINEFDEKRGSLFSWMYALVRFEALTQLRNYKTRFIPEQLPANLEIPSKENKFITMEAKEIVKLFSILPTCTRAVCKLFYLDDFSINEIKTSLNISEGTIKWHLSEGRKKLKLNLQKNMYV